MNENAPGPGPKTSTPGVEYGVLVDGEVRSFDVISSTNPKRSQYRLESALADVEPGPIRSYTWRHVQLDQGSEGACTGFSATMEAAARPVTVFGDPVKATPDTGMLNDTARRVYYRARQLDVWPGEDYDGSSVDGACLAGRELGWWDAWVWAHGSPEAQAEQVMRAVGHKGPVMMGSWWRRGMKADADGYFSYSGDRLGGHAYLLTAYNRGRDAVWTPNSWGGAGQGWIRRDDLIALFADGGEAALVQKRMHVD